MLANWHGGHDHQSRILHPRVLARATSGLTSEDQNVLTGLQSR